MRKIVKKFFLEYSQKFKKQRKKYFKKNRSKIFKYILIKMNQAVETKKPEKFSEASGITMVRTLKIQDPIWSKTCQTAKLVEKKIKIKKNFQIRSNRHSEIVVFGRNFTRFYIYSILFWIMVRLTKIKKGKICVIITRTNHTGKN